MRMDEGTRKETERSRVTWVRGIRRKIISQ